MSIPWKLYLTCWFLGASVQSAVFFSFNAVDYFNYFFPENYKPEVYIGVVVGVGATLGSFLTVTFQPKSSHLTVLVITQIISALLLVVEVVIVPIDVMKTPARFGVILAVIFAATVVQNVGGGALYSFVGEHFPKFGIHAAQSGGVCAFAATFVIRCISKGSFEHLKDRDRGFRLSGYLFVALVDLIILLACCLLPILRMYILRKGRVVNTLETAPLISKKTELIHVSRKEVIRKNWAAITTICLTLVISNSLFPGITSQFHGNYNCSSGEHPTNTNHSTTPPIKTNAPKTGDKTGWFVVVLFGCYSVADAIGKNLPIFGIIYNKTSILCNCLVQLVIAIPILLIYFEPCYAGLQENWVAYLTVGLLGLINGYGLCAGMMLLAPGISGNKLEESLATNIGYMFLQLGILLGMGANVFLVDYVFEVLVARDSH
ncbi:uncharacterized protein [Montipora capricornis]|uniref:uncharacterized protein n=1 Tax=Montipora foliosa TaxID=591990 RepID=UPI0035F2033E